MRPSGLRRLVLGGCIALAWMVAGTAQAQISDLVNFALNPESLVQLSVVGSASDTRTTSNGAETVTSQEGASALAGWAPGLFAIGATAATDTFVQESSGLELERSHDEQGAITTLRLGYVALVAGSYQDRLEIEAKDPLADVRLTLSLERNLHYELGMIISLGFAQLGFLRAFADIDLQLDLTANGAIEESYRTELDTVIARIRLEGDKGPFVGATFFEQKGEGDKGDVVDFGGSTVQSIGGEIGWKFSKESRMSLDYSQRTSTIDFPGTIEITEDAEDYGFRVNISENLTLGLSVTRARRRFKVGVPDVGSLSDVETTLSTARVGMGLRF